MTNDLVKFLKLHTYISLKHVSSVKDWILKMTTYVDVVIDNADVYKGGYGNWICRYTPPAQYFSYVSAHQEIDIIVKAAIKCINIIDKRFMPK